MKSPVEKLGTPIQTFAGMDRPCGVAVSQRGEVVVTEWTGHCVSVFSPSGQKIQSFGTHGSGQGQFDCPYGIAIDGDGNILVTDYNNHRLQKFTLKGQFLAAVGGKPLQFNCPIDITVSPTNDKVYVVDNTRHRILILNSDFTFSSTFGEYGIDQEQFRYPLGIACDSTGKVLVADSGNKSSQPRGGS